jgi:hypothetical protein
VREHIEHPMSEKGSAPLLESGLRTDSLLGSSFLSVKGGFGHAGGKVRKFWTFWGLLESRDITPHRVKSLEQVSTATTIIKVYIAYYCLLILR